MPPLSPMTLWQQGKFITVYIFDDPTTLQEGNFKAKQHARRLMRSYDDMVKNLSQSNTQVCDSRPEKMFKGQVDGNNWK